MLSSSCYTYVKSHTYNIYIYTYITTWIIKPHIYVLSLETSCYLSCYIQSKLHMACTLQIEFTELSQDQSSRSLHERHMDEFCASTVKTLENTLRYGALSLSSLQSYIQFCLYGTFYIRWKLDYLGFMHQSCMCRAHIDTYLVFKVEIRQLFYMYKGWFRVY